LYISPEETARRVAARVEAQFARGLIDEIRGLLAAGVPDSAHPFTGLVYRQALEYLHGMRDEAATRAACPDGWFRTGDLGVRHPDGYVELRDRAKDIIISGGENISSVEIERALTQHEAVLEAAVVAAPDEKWGETPVAFVTLKDGAGATEAALIEHVRTRLARFKAPRRIVCRSSSSNSPSVSGCRGALIVTTSHSGTISWVVR
jgi:acyl-CoA synthetase (AMP-forming)/AMP-acid ligase II